MNFSGGNIENTNSGWNFDGLPDDVQSIASTNESFAPNHPGGWSRSRNVVPSPALGSSRSMIPSDSSGSHRDGYRALSPHLSSNVSSNPGNNHPGMPSFAHWNIRSGSHAGALGLPIRDSSRASSVSSFPQDHIQDFATTQVSDEDNYTIFDDDGSRPFEYASMQPGTAHSLGNRSHGQAPFWIYDNDGDDDDSDITEIDHAPRYQDAYSRGGQVDHPLSVAQASLSNVGSRNSSNTHSEPPRNRVANPTAIDAVSNDEGNGGINERNEGQSAAFWPDLRPLLTDEAAIRNLHLQCPICYDASDDMRVLSCGHILCKDCLYRVLKNRDGARGNPRGRSRECPFCRIQLGKKRGCHPNCPQDKSWTIGLRVPASMAELDHFPLTIAEGGGKPLSCTDCREGRVMNAFKRLCQELLNDKHARVAISDGSQAANVAPDTHTAVPEMQTMCDAVMDVLYSPEFCSKYAGVQAPVMRKRATAEFIKRR
ncbi:hypothetical protein VD0002_g108 [Verticillium dahliae]|uniref:RING-type domain-containing protein n=1 Tax=Verticillium dahliae TaxID=27337 RepID=A0AA44W9W7_VERDA|nr:hypothetical protein BJF96_g9952 [Verticillium dahliae]PNH56648.1 hypothetical protein VD0003_g1073 [Verticillium dahliae]PNH70617.1 hypothetical protein VD0002_g108 [Verticillium dahliae]